MKALVIGGGIAGLGAATFLRERGHDVQVFEATDRVAGRAVTVRRPGSDDLCDAGTQYYHSNYDNALGLIRDVGLDSTLHEIRGDTRFLDSRVAPGSFTVGHRLPWIPPAGVIGNVRIGLWLAAMLLRHRMSTYALEDRPALDGVRALDAIEDPYMREFLVRTLVLVGGLTEPEVSDVCLLQVLRLAKIIVTTDYLTLSGGMASLHEALAARLDVRLETPVKRLVEERGRVVGVELDGTGLVTKADHVVVAVPPPHAAPMLPASWTDEREFLRSITFPPATIVSFFLDRPVDDTVWSWMMQAGTSKKIAFVTDASKKDPSMVPSERSIIQAWLCHPVAAEVAHLDDAAHVELCRVELDELFAGFSQWVEDTHVTRHAGGAIWHPVGHHERALRFVDSTDRREGVSFCGDYFSGGYLEPALWSARRAVTRIG